MVLGLATIDQMLEGIGPRLRVSRPGFALTDARASRPTAPVIVSMQRIYIGRNLTETHLVCGMLQSAGIRAHVRGQYLASGYGELPITTDTMPSVWLDDDRQRADALRVIAEYERPTYRPSWRCSQCGEVHGGQFTACWKCGREAGAAA